MTRKTIRHVVPDGKTAGAPTPEQLREAGSLPVCTASGIPVRVHGTFVLLLLTMGMLAVAQGAWRQALFFPGALAAMLLLYMNSIMP